jgi:N-acetyl-gamma-glutamyl-phosphate reductase
MDEPPRVSVFGAAGYAGALSARLIERHPTFSLTVVTARGDAGRRLDDIYPHHRVGMVLQELDLDRHADVEAAIDCR